MSETRGTKNGARARVRRQMAIEQGVDLQMNELVRGMRSLVDDSGIAKSRMEKHQMTNVLSVALETSSAALVENFILYQVGRDVSRTSWRQAEFGEKLARELRGLHARAEEIAEQVFSPSEPTDQNVDEIWILLVRQYLGQLNRYFYYVKEASRWGRR